MGYESRGRWQDNYNIKQFYILWLHKRLSGHEHCLRRRLKGFDGEIGSYNVATYSSNSEYAVMVE